MTTATLTKKEITQRVVFSQFNERNETSLVEVIVFGNGYTERFDNFFSEVSNEKWCTPAEYMAIRKTTSKAKKQDFINKYSEIFLSQGGRNK